jgi:predicted enzyme related to lactoylglutathione lyase
MGKRTKYTNGTFSWVDLTTTDQDGAKAFYGSLFGWDMTDNPAGEGVVYTIASIGGDSVAAISPQPQQQRDAGVPPTWNSYVTVGSADEALDRARQLGANVHAPAFDVFDAGRMGVIQDPQGAFVLVWQPGSNIGAGLVNAAGALSWNELASTDMDASAQFYGELFGWTFEPMDSPEMRYSVIRNADGQNNGGLRPAADSEPSYWLVYFGADAIEPALAQVAELGGNRLVGPMEIGPGTFGVAQDPSGAVFALYTGNFDD